MVALLDVNFLIALFDPTHQHHEPAHEWFRANRAEGWATCPLTENGMVRILSNPSFPGRRTTVQDAASRLSRFQQSGNHLFWPDSVSLRDEHLFQLSHTGGHRQITDVYLLALAVSRNGCLATFDGGIPVKAVAGATAKNLVVIQGEAARPE